MKVTEFYDEVSRRVDTDKTKINVAETKRVLSQGFRLLATLSAAELVDTLSKLISAADKANAKG